MKYMLKYLGVMGHKLCNLFSNGSEKINMYTERESMYYNSSQRYSLYHSYSFSFSVILKLFLNLQA